MKKGIIVNIIFLILCIIIGIGASIMNGDIKPLGEALIYFGGFSLFGWAIGLGMAILFSNSY